MLPSTLPSRTTTAERLVAVAVAAFPGSPYRRLRAAAVCFTVWGAAGILCTTVPSIAGNPHEAMVYFILFIVGVLLLLLSVAAPGDLP